MSLLQRNIALASFFISATLAAGCSEPDSYDEDYADHRSSCIPDWEIVEDVGDPCHMDVDRHIFYREVEAYGVYTYADLNGCYSFNKYEKVEIDSKKCSYPISGTINGVSISFGSSSRRCSSALFAELTGTAMPESVYDKDACPAPRIDPGGGGGGGGGGSQQIQ